MRQGPEEETGKQKENWRNREKTRRVPGVRGDQHIHRNFEKFNTKLRDRERAAN
jgi:hypothetical protein